MIKKVLYKIVKTFIEYFLKGLIQSLQFIVIGGIALYYQKPGEGLCVLIGFWVMRAYCDKTYHHLTILGCTLISAVSFGLIFKIVPTFGEFLVLPIVSGVAMAVIFSIVEDLRLKLEKGDCHVFRSHK